jgi:hypothetical protein
VLPALSCCVRWAERRHCGCAGLSALSSVVALHPYGELARRLPAGHDRPLGHVALAALLDELDQSVPLEPKVVKTTTVVKVHMVMRSGQPFSVWTTSP